MSSVRIEASTEKLPLDHESVMRNASVLEQQPISSPLFFDIDFKEEKQHETWSETVMMSHALTHDAKTLQKYLEAQAKLVPDPILRIRGTHKQSYAGDGYRRYDTLTDFNLTISLRDQLAHRAHMKIAGNSTRAYRGTRTKKDGLNKDAELCRPIPSLEEWCHDFCGHRKGPKRLKYCRGCLVQLLLTSLEQLFIYTSCWCS